MPGSWTWRAIAVGATVASALGACSGDDDVDASDTTEADEPAAAEVEAFCDEIGDVGFEVSIGEGYEGLDQALMAAEEIAPAQIRADVTTMADENRAQLDAGPPPEDTRPDPASDEYFTAAAAVGDYLADHCGYQVIDVTATDHTFTGIPAQAAGGKTLIQLTNDGTEYHELILQRVHFGETRSIEEILALPDGGDLLDFRAIAFTPPGQRSWTVVELHQRDRYGAMCLVPTGATTPDTLRNLNADEDTPRHHTQGMTADFHVP